MLFFYRNGDPRGVHLSIGRERQRVIRDRAGAVSAGAFFGGAGWIPVPAGKRVAAGFLGPRGSG